MENQTYPEMTTAELATTLGLTIKRDETNKLVTFLCQLTAYTDNAQFNISFNAPSSTGKSYIPMEIAQLFPREDVRPIGHCSPTAFYHEAGLYDKERKAYIVDLARKILIFMDQPHTMLLERLRPLLSHDQKEMEIKIADKSGQGGLRTKTVYIKGFPAVIFCSAALKIDEQEGTRFWLLSPEINQEKMRESIHARIVKETDPEAYAQLVASNPERMILKDRIIAIRDAQIDDVRIPFPELVEKEFLAGKKALKPRHQRDIGRLVALVKAIALFNHWHRERQDKIIVAHQSDFDQALALWKGVAVSQEYNLPPYLYDLYVDVILAAYREKNDSAFAGITEPRGITRKELFQKHNAVYGRSINPIHFRQQTLPMLEAAGLISQEPDPNDKRKMLVYTLDPLTTSATATESGDTVSGTGVNEDNAVSDTGVIDNDIVSDTGVYDPEQEFTAEVPNDFV